MYKDNLFKLIRSEQVVLWVGAGFSLYAGYPSGYKLTEMLYNELSASEKDEINSNQMLTQLAQDFYRIKGGNKNALISFLKKTFLDTTPTSTEYHDKIAKLPFFKNIITTNYDTLFEDAYGKDGNVIYLSKHIPYQSESKTSIFKIHGDLQDPDSIILTTEDYNRFFSNDSEGNIFWNTIKEKLSSKVILFLGYNLEDPNISVIFDKVCNELGDHRKECFFIAPGVKRLKQEELLRKKIHYIDMTGEQFIEDLLVDINENAIGDLYSGHTSADAFRKLLNKQNMLPKLTALENSYRLDGIQGLDKPITGLLNFQLKEDENLQNELKNFTDGKKFGEFKVDRDQLKDWEMTVGGLKMPKEELLSLMFVTKPARDTIVSIVFEDHFEIENLPVKIFASKHIVEFHLDFGSALVKVILNQNSHALENVLVKFEIEHAEKYRNISDGLKLFNFIEKISSGLKFTVFHESGYKLNQDLLINNMMEDLELFLQYFKSLKEIEQYFNIKFTNIPFDTINNKNLNAINRILHAINGIKIDYADGGEIKILLKNFDDEFYNLEIGQHLDSPFIIKGNGSEIIDIYGHNIELFSDSITIFNPYIEDISYISDSEATVVVKSKDNDIHIIYKLK